MKKPAIIRESITDPESALLIYFDVKNNKIDRINGHNVNLYGQYDLKNKGDFCYNINYFKNTNKIKIIKFTRAFTLRPNSDYRTDEFWCTVPREQDDSIHIRCNGIHAVIYPVFNTKNGND